MRIASVSHRGRVLVVVHTERGLVDVESAAGDVPWRGATLRERLEGGADAMAHLRRAAESSSARTIPESEVAFLPPILDPPRIFCIGRNYAEHAREGKADVPDFPMIFFKPSTTLTGHDSTVSVPSSTAKVDWEGEIVAVLGRGGRDIPEDRALDHVAGLTLGNDLTARDWQRRTTQFDAGKMFDGFGPMGPYLVTIDEFHELDSLQIATYVNGALMQSGRVADMIFPIAHLVSYLSQAVRLLPGDVIMTGTPSGVGYARRPPVFLDDGDVVEVRVEELGCLRNVISRTSTVARPGGGDRPRADALEATGAISTEQSA